MAQPEPYSSYLNEKMSRKNAKLIWNESEASRDILISWLEMEGLNV